MKYKGFIFITACVISTLLNCSNGIDDEDHKKPIIPPDTIEIPPKEPIIWKDYIKNKLELLKDSTWPDGKGETYWALGNFLFVPTQKIFLGELIHPQISIGELVKRLPVELSYNKISCSLGIFVDKNAAYDINAGISQTDSIFNLLKAVLPETKATDLSKRESYSSRKEVFLKHAYLGLNLDSILFGKRYWQEEISSKYGYIVENINPITALYMDYMPNLLTKDLDDEIIKNYQPAIIQSISWGYFKIIAIESDYPKIDELIRKTLQNKSLNVDEINILEKSLIISTSIINNKFVTQSIRYQDISKIQIVNKANYAPIYVQLAGYKTYEPIQIQIKIDVPK